MESAALEAAARTVVKGALSKPVEKLIQVLELIYCYRSKVDSLKDETHGLEKKLADVKCLIYNAERNGKEILQEPSNWVKDSETKLEEAENVFQKSSRLQPCCWPFNISNCNCKRRYEVGDKAVELKKDIEKLMSTGKSINEMTVSLRPGRPPRLPLNFAHQYRALDSMEGYIETLKGWLIGDQKREIVGVYGSKGAGKTLLVKRVAVVLDSDDKGEVNGVVYISAAAAATGMMELKSIQQGVAERVGLVLQHEDVLERGIWLIARLVAIGNLVFIVDDVEANNINFDLFGIPWSHRNKNGCRFVVVSTSLNICKQMNTEMELEVEPLSTEESLQLFKGLVVAHKHSEGASNTFQAGIDHIFSRSTWLAGHVIDYHNRLYFGGTEWMDVKPEGIELVTEKLEGSTPLRVQNEVWEALARGESRIGIYGMGGVGKTSVAMHINNEILVGRHDFQHVYYVTVSRDSSVPKLQGDISRALQLHLEMEDDEKKRAAELRKGLKNRVKSLLILDDIWEDISVEKVGVAVEGDGCKLLITTRKRDVCRKLKCSTIVEMKPLLEKEAFDLFVTQLGDYEKLSDESKCIAGSICKECSGLPLAIITMARCMRGELDQRVWRETLRQLQNPSRNQDDMEDKVFSILELSYERLNNHKLRQCLLYCALYPEDCNIWRDGLINLFTSAGLIEETTPQENRDKGHFMLNALESASLLEPVTNYRGERCNAVKMHDLIRDMALKIIGCKGIVKARKGLTKLPRKDEWTKDLVLVSLMENKISNIDDEFSPECPCLSVLILRANYLLVNISQAFFLNMAGLKVLDLSLTPINQLPNSVSNLRGLSALLLQKCGNLSIIPSLAELTKLKELDLFCCKKITGFPVGAEELINLKHLDIRRTGIQCVPDGVVYKLNKLECFLSDHETVILPNKLMSLSQLWRLEGLIEDIDTFNQFVGSEYFEQLKMYILNVSGDMLLNFSEIHRGAQIRYCRSIIGTQVWFEVPHNVGELELTGCKFGVNSLLEALPSLCGATELNKILFHQCTGIEYIISDAWFKQGGNRSLKPFARVQRLEVSQVYDLVGLIQGAGMVRPYICFDGLTELEIFWCRSLNNICLQNYELPPNLISVTLEFCDNMEELFPSTTTQVRCLPKLQNLRLITLSGLTSICRNGVFFPELKKLIVNRCPKLKKLGLMNQNMPCLEKIVITDCSEMEEIFDSGDEDLQLPNLSVLAFQNLPELRSICRKAIVCPCLERVYTWGCEKLENIPISVPMPLKVIPELTAWSKPEDWWNSLYWNDPTTQQVFNQLGCFRYDSINQQWWH